MFIDGYKCIAVQMEPAPGGFIYIYILWTDVKGGCGVVDSWWQLRRVEVDRGLIRLKEVEVRSFYVSGKVFKCE
jgi:hypothetical protein